MLELLQMLWEHPRTGLLTVRDEPKRSGVLELSPPHLQTTSQHVKQQDKTGLYKTKVSYMLTAYFHCTQITV